VARRPGIKVRVISDLAVGRATITLRKTVTTRARSGRVTRKLLAKTYARKVVRLIDGSLVFRLKNPSLKTGVYVITLRSTGVLVKRTVKVVK
jgi:hypothetical protein